jgi:hypothetical protein
MSLEYAAKVYADDPRRLGAAARIYAKVDPYDTRLYDVRTLQKAIDAAAAASRPGPAGSSNGSSARCTRGRAPPEGQGAAAQA